MKIYCFNNGGSDEWYSAVAICEDGHCLAQHICSSPAFMPHDLGITSTRKHDNYNAHCGVGNWELEWVSNPKEHAGLQQAFLLNQALSKEPEVKAPELPACPGCSMANGTDGWAVVRHELPLCPIVKTNTAAAPKAGKGDAA